MKYFYALIASWLVFNTVACTQAPPKYETLTIELPPECKALPFDTEPHYCTNN